MVKPEDSANADNRLVPMNQVPVLVVLMAGKEVRMLRAAVVDSICNRRSAAASACTRACQHVVTSQTTPAHRAQLAWS
jgi:hypothetical protein